MGRSRSFCECSDDSLLSNSLLFSLEIAVLTFEVTSLPRGLCELHQRLPKSLCHRSQWSGCGLRLFSSNTGKHFQRSFGPIYTPAASNEAGFAVAFADGTERHRLVPKFSKTLSARPNPRQATSGRGGLGTCLHLSAHDPEQRWISPVEVGAEVVRASAVGDSASQRPSSNISMG